MTTQEILQAAQGAKMPLAVADADTKIAALEAMTRFWKQTSATWTLPGAA